MMLKKIISGIALVVMLHPAVQGQDKSSKKSIRFGSLTYAGIHEGEAGTGFQLQMINGIRYKTWFAGIGTGIDYYFERSVPLFFSVTKFFPAMKAPLFINGDIGMNFPWNPDNVYYTWSPGKLSSSLYWAGGAGYKFSFRKSPNNLLLNVGYSFKHLIQFNQVTFPCLIQPCPTGKERYDYRLNRLSVKLGWMF